ncbi:hypothetical protein DPMN_170332 [Dreissena polymorpha]|uniref:Uncharacterized protein n=1 Tax=Dreissena polymorpha TaxID=45954 RepID=A0A9D4ICS6_DREPO|nr:hypothetical protein DPMN_170332 [Dreissena polymorpha]
MVSWRNIQTNQGLVAGWTLFLNRHNIVIKKQSGELASVNGDTVTNWKSKIESVCEGYVQSDIFNMDETGLFFRDTKKTIYFKKGEILCWR